MSTDTKPISADPLFTFTIARGTLVAFPLFQSSDSTRGAICCTCFEFAKAPGGHCNLVLVATDGRALLTYTTEIINDDLFGELPESLALSVDISGVKKLPKKKGVDQVDVAVFEKHVEFSAGALKYSAKRSEDIFPNWRQIVQADALKATESISFNPEYVADFGTAAKLITGKPTITVGLRGADRIIEITSQHDRGFIGGLMPCKFDDDCRAESMDRERNNALGGFVKLCRDSGTTVEIRTRAGSVKIDGNGIAGSGKGAE